MMTAIGIKVRLREEIRRHSASIERAIAKHDKIMKSIRDECPHDWTFVSDPSGNNDSYWSCGHCQWTRNRQP